MKKLAFSTLFASLAALAFTLGGCGDDGGANNAASNDQGCEHECEQSGDERCHDGAIEVCRNDSDGCRVWESDVDCGGNGQYCTDDGSSVECAGGADETCDDGELNQDETDVDCGGTLCEPCGDGEGCEEDSDCETGHCDEETDLCGEAEPTCDDGIQNQDETDVDCGGSCAPCDEGEQCEASDDCETNNCDVGDTDTCVPEDEATCTDGVQNQDETDVDCGGSTCPACDVGAECEEHNDCDSGVCDFIDTDTCIDATPQYEVDEDFETGDFSLFDYEFWSDEGDGGNDWEVVEDPSECYEGDHCMRTSPAHQLGETTSVSVRLSVREETEISFWAKTDTEEDEYVFRFYIDGEEQLELSGDNGWQEYSFEVDPTKPNGDDRTFTWEYERSEYQNPDRPARNEVWVDYIDMPAWNTQPTVPEQLAPGNGKVTTDRTPTFRWRSFDPDFDAITYELEYDTDPDFSDPGSTGETTDEQFTPADDLDDQTVYFWRVRAKDDSDYRWSSWSPTFSLHVDSEYEHGDVWRQSTGEQFGFNELTGDGKIVGDSVEANAEFSRRASDSTFVHTNSLWLNYNNLPDPQKNVSATFDVTVNGDFKASTAHLGVYVDGDHITDINPSVSCEDSTHQVTIPDIGQYTDGGITIRLKPEGWVTDYCGTHTAEGDLGYDRVSDMTMTTEVIDFEMFDSRDHWEKLQWVGQGDVEVHVLDDEGDLIPEDALPGNEDGFAERTVHLWHLDSAQYPKIRLEARVEEGAGSLDEWRVVGSDVYEWTFHYDGDSEGWRAKDDSTNPSTSVQDGVLRVESTDGGDNTRIDYTFDKPIQADDFTTVEVRLRTSNNDHDDDVTFYWASNYGDFDGRRSFVEEDVFLLDFRDVTFDLTQSPASDKEPWQGDIEGLRLEPVEEFLDQVGDPADGWFEIERIAMY